VFVRRAKTMLRRNQQSCRFRLWGFAAVAVRAVAAARACFQFDAAGFSLMLHGLVTSVARLAAS
jgi:hypothetical protein